MKYPSFRSFSYCYIDQPVIKSNLSTFKWIFRVKHEWINVWNKRVFLFLFLSYNRRYRQLFSYFLLLFYFFFFFFFKEYHLFCVWKLSRVRLLGSNDLNEGGVAINRPQDIRSQGTSYRIAFILPWDCFSNSPSN